MRGLSYKAACTPSASLSKRSSAGMSSMAYTVLAIVSSIFFMILSALTVPIIIPLVLMLGALLLCPVPPRQPKLPSPKIIKSRKYDILERSQLPLRGGGVVIRDLYLINPLTDLSHSTYTKHINGFLYYISQVDFDVPITRDRNLVKSLYQTAAKLFVTWILSILTTSLLLIINCGRGAFGPELALSTYLILRDCLRCCKPHLIPYRHKLTRKLYYYYVVGTVWQLQHEILDLKDRISDLYFSILKTIWRLERQIAYLKSRIRILQASHTIPSLDQHTNFRRVSYSKRLRPPCLSMP